MKKTLFVIFAVFTFTGVLTAQDEETISNKFGASFHLCQYQRDFGFGMNITSPYFAHGRIALRLKGNMMYYQHIKGNLTTWSPYYNASLGIIGVGGKVGEFIRLYGEGGVVGLFPSEEFSSESFVVGGYGLFGFEFYMMRSFNYFIEIGGIGTGAVADKIQYEPIYSNGLLISTGFRAQF